MKKKIMVGILLVGMLSLTGCGSATKLSNGEEVVVEFSSGDTITVDDIWKDMKDNYALSVLLDKIDMKILEEELKDQMDDVNSYMESYEASMKANYTDDDGNYDESALLKAISYYGYSSLEAMLNNKKIDYMTNLVAKEYAKDKITSKEIKDYYKSDIVGDIHCVHILVKPEDDSTSSSEEAKSKAQEIIANIKSDIKSGTSAKDAFAKYADNEDVKYEDLNYFNKGDMVTEFEDAAYALKVGAYTTSPVKTTYGYHVILKLDEKEKAKLDDSMKEEIKTTLADKKVEDDDDISVNAMIELRKKYGVKWDDSTLEEQYNKYMNYQLNQK